MKLVSWTSTIALSWLFDRLLLSGAVVLTSQPEAIANRTFDYIIVGGGTAGLTVRLSLRSLLEFSTSRPAKTLPFAH